MTNTSTAPEGTNSNAAADASKSQTNESDILTAFERAVYTQSTAEAVDRLIELLKFFGKLEGVRGLLTPRPARRKIGIAYTRAAAAITTLVNSPQFIVSGHQFAEMCLWKEVLEAIFTLGGFVEPEHLLRYHAKIDAEGNLRLSGQQPFLLSLFYSLDNLPPELLQGILRLGPNEMLMLMLGWLRTSFVHTEAGERNRSALLSAYTKIANADLVFPDVMLPAMANCWMYCSYAGSNDKHVFKKGLNEVWKRFCATERLKSRSRPYRGCTQPLLLVTAERMGAGHAMHRSYAASIEQLRPRFRVVCMVMEQDYLPDTAYLFDEVIVLERVPRLAEIGAKIVKLEPDLIYYPSIGMSVWTIAIAMQRFAPIQFMTLGHPAPTMLDSIDYSLVQTGHGVAAHEFGNKVLERKAWGSFVPHEQLPAERPARSRTDDGALHIAVNSTRMKLSPRFLALCERLQREATRPLHFHFFASAKGIAYDLIDQVLSERFERMTLEPSQSYGAFLEALAQCDLALAAFPFGNTNSTVDTCILGIPTVAYFANEVLSIGDRDVLRMAGMPDWLVSSNDEDYFKVAMRLIHDDAERQALSEQLKNTDVRGRFFAAPTPEDKTEFADAVWWMYENHEALQRSPAHTIKVGGPIPA